MGWAFHKHTNDPVCGKRIDPVKTGIAAVHKGRAYYFCSSECWAAFQSTPSRYIGAPMAAPRGWWGRYVKRVAKSTGGKPPCCH
jgi:YHS domain-containing protein